MSTFRHLDVPAGWLPVCRVFDEFGKQVALLESYSYDQTRRQHVFLGVAEKAGTLHTWEVVRGGLVVSGRFYGGEGDVDGGQRLDIRFNAHEL